MFSFRRHVILRFIDTHYFFGTKFIKLSLSMLFNNSASDCAGTTSHCHTSGKPPHVFHAFAHGTAEQIFSIFRNEPVA